MRRDDTRSRRGGERGQILVIVAGGLVVMILAVGLVIDTGVGYMARRGGQNAADLAAMAGTKMIADHYVKNTSLDGPDVYTAIDTNITTNGCTVASTCTWTAEYVKPNGPGAEQDLGAVTAAGALPAGAQGVRVNVSRTPETFFMRVIGLNTIAVSTAATAMTATVDTLPPGQVLPIAADPPGNYEPGLTYELTAGKDGPGNFSWLSWDGSNDPNSLATSICTPDNPELTFPAWVTGDPGTSNSSSVRACVDYWIDSGTTVLIPMWDQVTGNGNNTQFRVVGLAAFVLVARGQPAIDSIQGQFVGFYGLPSVSAGYGGAPDPTDSNGSYFLGLVR